MIQEILVLLLVLGAVAYVVYRFVWLPHQHKNNNCGGCCGCSGANNKKKCG